MVVSAGGNRSGAPTIKVSSRDLPGHKTVKVRQRGQASAKDLESKDFAAALGLKKQPTAPAFTPSLTGEAQDTQCTVTR